MCLSTVYRSEKQEENVLCKLIASFQVEGDTLTFVDIMGQRTTVTGHIVSADLTAGTVIINAN